MRRIKTVQIGTGHDHAYANFETAVHSGLFDVVGYVVVDEYNEQKNGFKNDFKVPRITLEQAWQVEGLEAVIIETYDLYLVKYAQMAADRGLHVFMDKPGSESVEDFERLLSTVKSKGKVFNIGYMYRYNPMVKELVKAVSDGALGKIYSVEAQMNCDHDYDKRQWQEGFKGGMTFFLGSHLVDLIHTFMGVPDEIVPYNTSTGLGGVTSVDLGFAVFKYKDGVAFLKTSDAELGGFERRQLVVCGEHGTMRVEPLEWHCSSDSIRHAQTATLHKAIGTEHGWKTWEVKAEVEQSEVFGRYDGMFIDFAQRITKGIPSTNEELLREARVHRMVLAACGIACDYKGDVEL